MLSHRMVDGGQELAQWQHRLLNLSIHPIIEFLYPLLSITDSGSRVQA